MAYLFPSAEWLEQLVIEINRSEAYANSGKTWEGDFLFVIKPGGDLKEPVRFYLDLWHGKCREAHLLIEPNGRKAEFAIASTLPIFRQIFTKRLDAIQALMTRKLELQGNIMKIMKSVKATTDLVNCCSLIDTIYVDGTTREP